MTITIGNMGAVLGTQLYRPKTSPRWYLGHGFALGYLCFNILNTLILWAALRKENARKRERAAAGEVAPEGSVKTDEDVRWIFQT